MEDVKYGAKTLESPRDMLHFYLDAIYSLMIIDAFRKSNTGKGMKFSPPLYFMNIGISFEFISILVT
jgi:hypothetical protein